MTAPTKEARALWATMPGWGIVADLIPPEIVQQRRLKAIRRYVIVGLSTMLVLIVAVYALAYLKKSSASDALAKAKRHTAQLQTELSQYSDVITIQGTVKRVQSQVASLMKTDVDLPKLITDITSAAPPGTSVGSLTITLASSAGTGAGAPGSGLYTGGTPLIGNVSISCTGRTLTDASAYVDRLSALPGIVEPYPTSNSASSTGANFAIQLTVNADRYTHKYDSSSTGVK